MPPTASPGSKKVSPRAEVCLVAFTAPTALAARHQMQGYLKKKSPKPQGKAVVDVWQRRYFVLADDKLQYFRTEKDAASSSEQPLKSIALAQVRSAAPNPKHRDMIIIDLGAERRVKLQAASEEDRDAWVAAIQRSKAEAQEKEAQETDTASSSSSPPGACEPSGARDIESDAARMERLVSESDPVPPMKIEARDLLSGGSEPSKKLCCAVQ